MSQAAGTGSPPVAESTGQAGIGVDLGTASRATLRDLLTELDRLERAGATDRGQADHLDALGNDVRAVAALASREPGLRRALTDPSREGSDRARLAHRLFDDRVSAAAVEITAMAAGGRWSAPRDLVDALDLTATAAEVAAADRAGQLDSLEDDLFRFSRIVAGTAQLRTALSDRSAPEQSRADLVRRLLADRTGPAAIRLAVAAATDLRERPIEVALAEDGHVVAARRNRVVALVRVAAPLTDDQRERLTALLARQAGRTVQLNIIEDPSLIGGFQAEVGETVLDASVASRLSEARRRLTG